jgi:hypothetical protein
VLWTGSPVRHPVFDSSDRLAVPGAIFGVAFMVFWMTTVVETGAPAFFLVAGSLGLAWTVYLLLGRPCGGWSCGRRSTP